MSSSVHIDNKIKDISILCERLTQELDYTTLPAEARYHFNFTQPRKRSVWSLHYNGATVSNLLMLQKYISSKRKILK